MTAKIHETTIALQFSREEAALLIKDTSWPTQLKKRFMDQNYPRAHVFECDDMELFLSGRLSFPGDTYGAYFSFYASHISESIISDTVAEYLQELRQK